MKWIEEYKKLSPRTPSFEEVFPNGKCPECGSSLQSRGLHPLLGDMFREYITCPSCSFGEYLLSERDRFWLEF